MNHITQIFNSLFVCAQSESEYIKKGSDTKNAPTACKIDSEMTGLKGPARFLEKILPAFRYFYCNSLALDGATINCSNCFIYIR